MACGRSLVCCRVQPSGTAGFEVVIAADIFYGNSVTAGFLKCLPCLMSPGGICYAMIVLERDDKSEFERLAHQAGFRSAVACWLRYHVSCCMLYAMLQRPARQQV